MNPYTVHRIWEGKREGRQTDRQTDGKEGRYCLQPLLPLHLSLRWPVPRLASPRGSRRAIFPGPLITKDLAVGFLALSPVEAVTASGVH